MTEEERTEEIQRLFKTYQSPYTTPLVHILGDLEKDWPADYADWKDFVIDVMKAMDADNAGQFDVLWSTEENDQ